MEMIDNVEWEYANVEVLKALKAGNAALNALHQEMSVDDVQTLLEETNEAIQVPVAHVLSALSWFNGIFVQIITTGRK